MKSYNLSSWEKWVTTNCVLLRLLVLFVWSALGKTLWATEPSVTLKVALYPYLPDTCKDRFEAFEVRIENEFEAMHPEIDLVLRPLNSEGSFYDYTYLKQLFSEYDLVETDSMYLGQLMQDGLLAAWRANPCERVDWQVVPLELCKSVRPYAWPHWQCGYFAFGKAAELEGVDSFEAFKERLEAVPGNLTPLIIDLNDKMGLADMYLDAWTDQATNATLDVPSFEAQHNATLATFETFADYACTPKGKEPALKGLYNTHSNVGALLFARDKAAYYIGYSEAYAAIHQAIRNGSEPIMAIHAPWGPYHNPTLAVDSLTLSTEASAEVKAAATLFAQYLTTPSTYAWMVLGEDCKGEPRPRYLLPASLSAYTQTAIGENSMMVDYFKAIQKGANAMPWNYYSAIAKAMGVKLLETLERTVNCTQSVP